MTMDEYVKSIPSLCQLAMSETLKELFSGQHFNGQEGTKELGIYMQDLPVPENNDEDVDTDDSVAPCILITLDGGTVEDETSPQLIYMSLTICAYDDSHKRHGWADVQNIKEQILQRFCSKPYFGGMYTVLKPIEWSLQADDTHPYFWGAVNLTVTAPAMAVDPELERLL